MRSRPMAHDFASGRRKIATSCGLTNERTRREGGRSPGPGHRQRSCLRRRTLPSRTSSRGSWLGAYSLLALCLLAADRAHGRSSDAFLGSKSNPFPSSFFRSRATAITTLRGSQALSSETGGSLWRGQGADASDDFTSGREEASPKRWCANTVQGRVLVTDDRGYTCRRWELLPASGCCPGKARPGGSDTSSGVGEEEGKTGAAVHRRTSSKSLLAFPNPVGREEGILRGVEIDEGSLAESDGLDQGEEDEGGRFSCLTCNLTKGCCTSYEHCVSCCLSPRRTPARVALSTPRAQQPSATPFASVFEYCATRCRHNSKSVVHENAYISELHHCYRAPRLALSSPEGQGGAAQDPPGQDVKPVVAARRVSCDDACSKVNMKCDVRYFPQVNNCTVLRQHLGCRTGCFRSSASDRPSEVADSAPARQRPGACLINADPELFSCSGYHDNTRRLCPCRHWLAVR